MPHSILCVDDDRNLCQILSKALAGEGYSVRTAHDGEEALAAFRAEPPDLLLLDLMLPRRDGFGVLEEVRREPGPAGQVPVVLLSGCTQTPEYSKRARDLQATRFLTKPVPLRALLDHVQKALSASPPLEARRRNGPARPTLTGFLDELPFPSLLHHLHGLRASGTLLLRNGRKKKALQIHDGRPVAVKSNLVSECLGNLLVRMGKIDQAQLAESVRRVQGGEGLQGEILVAMSVLSEQEVANALAVQAEEKLFEIFEWDEGGFEFRRDQQLKGAGALARERSPADVVLSGVRSRFPISRIDPLLEAFADLHAVVNESPFYRFQDVELDRLQQGLLERCEQAPLVRQLINGDEAGRRALYGLVATELVELRASASPSSGRAAAPAAEPRPAPAAEPRPGPAARPTPPRQPGPEDEGIRVELASLAERMRGRTFFEILGVDAQTAGDEDVRLAYVDLAKRTHPDRFRANGEAVVRLAEEIFGLVSRAHAALADAQGRAAYRAELVRGERDAAQLEEARQALSAEQHFQQGEGALKIKRFAQAFECFERAVELYPEEGEYLAYLGWTRFLCDPDEPRVRDKAVRELKQAVKLAPASEKPFLFMGRICKALGRDEAAERMFSKAIQVRSECVEALRELRLINMRKEKAKGLVRRLLRR